MQMCHINDLPQELHDRILDSLRYEKPTLQACALVQRVWLQRARKWIHRSVTVSTAETDPSRYACPEVAQLVKQVTIAPISKPPTPSMTEYCASGPTLSPFDNTRSTQRMVLFEFPQCTLLTLLYCGFPALTLEDREQWAAAFPNVTTLHMNEQQFSTVSDFILFLDAFPMLQALRIDELSFFTSTSIPPASLSSDTRTFALKEIDIDLDDYDTTADIASCWFPAISQTLSQETSMILNCYPSTVHYLPTILRCLGNVLKRLCLRFWGDEVHTAMTLLGACHLKNAFTAQRSLNSCDICSR